MTWRQLTGDRLRLVQKIDFTGVSWHSAGIPFHHIADHEMAIYHSRDPSKCKERTAAHLASFMYVEEKILCSSLFARVPVDENLAIF